MLIWENFGDAIWFNLVHIITSWDENSTFGEEIMITFADWIPQYGMCSAENYLETLQSTVYFDTILTYKYAMLKCYISKNHIRMVLTLENF